MSQVRLSFEGTNAIELAEMLKGFPGCEVAVQVLDDGTVRGPSQEQIQKVIVTLTLGAKLLQQGADAGSSGLEFLKNLQDFQGGSQAIEKIVVIPEEGDRSSLTKPSGDALVKAIEENR
jgi:hypothetical protein